MKIRLDQALATNGWKQKYQEAEVHLILASSLDHSMRALWINKNGRAQPRSHHKLFHFEAMWLKDPRCDEVVIDSWQEGLNKIGGSTFSNCIESYRANLRVWNKREFGHVGRKIAEL